ncbi:hypothetical protein [Deinococcus sp. JMULE3]|uniref:hypothetical protein n=1 Tax=Deinococcus sp. JMULE3 TaxID=2518341 RepID=UPI0015774452|nr:hypothetical protein [Deinococcus sp. JMULE3]NTY01076.1 hypothetical protein [Deinococcus sp. JMULE3]
MIFLSIAHAFVCFTVLIIAFFAIRNQKSSILSLTVVGFILLDSISLSYIPYFDLSNIPYLDNPEFLINDLDADRYSSQIFSHWIFLSISSLLLFFQSKSTNEHYRKNISFRSSIVISLFALGLISTARYMFLGPGLEILLTTQISFASTSDAIASRSLLREKIENGQGAYLASLSSKIIFPLFASYIIYSGNKYKYAWWGLCSMLSLVYAIQTREKAPVVLSLLLYIAILLWGNLTKSGLLKSALSQYLKAISIASIVFIVSGTAIYSVNFGLTPTVAIQSILLRTLAVPGATETNFFEVFPKDFRYRGLHKIFKMPLTPGSSSASDTSIYEVATTATGRTFASNASIVAVAWSGAGYFGVGIISSILFSILFFIDGRFKKFDPNIHSLAMYLSIPSLLGLTSGGFADYTTWGGILLPAIVLGVLVSKNSEEVN